MKVKEVYVGNDGREYATKEECVKADELFEAKAKKEEDKKKRVDEIVEAEKNYIQLVRAYLKDYPTEGFNFFELMDLI